MKNIVCFGCGDLGKYFAETYTKYLNIKFYLDNCKDDKQFCGYDRFLPSKERCSGNFIVVTNIRFYHEIAKQLSRYGLEENSDFISIKEFEKRYPLLREDLRTIRCWFVDFWDGFDPYDNFIINALRKYYNIILDSKSPDFLFSSLFYSKRGLTTLKYSCVRIFYTGENLIPDFNIYDYAIGFDYINYGDRYLRWPLYYLYQSDFELAKKKHYTYDMDQFMERDFCCRVVSCEKSEFRERVFMEINERKFVASGGRCKNNLSEGTGVENKRKFLGNYKFNLAMENANSPGYVTEKIVQAWAAGCIPIYWGGGGRIGEDFNKEAFIDCNDFATIKELIEYLDSLEHDRDAIEKILAAPILLEEPKTEILERFLKNIIDKTDGEKIRRLSAVNIYAKKHEQMYLNL